ncbi:run domain Beclin-1-interacting and cysteine-rich domain-containing protein isoform X1 [Hydra vulgaris]|uniref:run domain Beclin-1-interacting and cysteine-rich domain-containing protein isoform X1 n=1 Tax=Hydra vulgaris TaxID=6087 RepID=UPI001F5F6A76|nr:run domain Beclin-1-interacting and cysteine-rich domain-containing protein [Hydra vulgaris]
MDAKTPENISYELFELLSSFINTVEGVLACNNQNVWNVFGGLSRTKKTVFNILVNGLRSSDNKDRCERENENEIQMLNDQLLIDFTKENMDSCDSTQRLNFWIEAHLLDHSLYDHIKRIFDDSNKDLLNLYKEFSFLKNKMLLSAFLDGIDSLRQNSTDKLSSINVQLMDSTEFVKKLCPWVSEKIVEEYKIASSTPVQSYFKDFYDNHSCNICGSSADCGCSVQRSFSISQKSCINQSMLLKSALLAASDQENVDHWYCDINEKARETKERLLSMQELCNSETLSFNNPEVNATEQNSEQFQTDVSQLYKITEEDPYNELFSLPRSSMVMKGHHRSKSDQDGSASFVDKIDSGIASSLPKEFLEQHELINGTESCYYRDEDGKIFPKPYKGQSLISYLESRSYNTGAQLDKENAHFSICEALITAIEQMRCENVHSEHESDGDEEIKILKKRIHARKKTLKKQRASYINSHSDSNKSSILKTSSTVSSSDSFGSTAVGDTSSSPPDKQAITISASWENITQLGNKSRTHESESKEDIDKVEIIQEDEILPDDFTAETVAKCLLKKFQGHMIPAASELKWMVSEENVSQQLLPLPNALPVSPDTYLPQNECNLESALQKVSLPSLIRGNMDWAPPRPQIVLMPHVFVKKKVMLQRQQYRCAGCGLKVSPSLSRLFRFCEYLGKYFCTSCHQNNTSLIPAKILSKWDFKKYPVSDFAKEYIKEIYTKPLFDISGISPSLYDNVRLLALTNNWRIQLYYIKKFLSTCRMANSELGEISKLPFHLAEETQLYSIDDLVQTKSGELQTKLKTIVMNAVQHIKVSCQLCSAKGFVCEFCKNGDDVLYPFELQKVEMCKECKTCYHRSCFAKGFCPRCDRIKARKRMLEFDTLDTT